MNAAVHAEFVVPAVRSKRLQRVRLCAELVLLDCAAIIAAFAVAGTLSQSSHLLRNWELMAVALVCYVGCALSAQIYSSKVFTNPAGSLRRTITTLIYALVAVVVLAYATHMSSRVSRAEFGVGAILSMLLLVTGRVYFVRFALQRLGGSIKNELLIVDGVQAPQLRLAHRINAGALGLTPDLDNPEMLHRIGSLVRDFDRVVVAAVPERRDAWTLLLRGANIEGELLQLNQPASNVIALSRVGDLATHVVSRGPLNLGNRAAKRVLDLAITVPAVLLLSPLFGIVALAIKLDSPGPILFKQDRVGRGNRLFKVLKFRSMRVEQSDAAGVRSASRDDDRITRVGRFIRRTSIDELPQLLNVLLGTMSLVGPRPHALGSRAGDKLFWEVDQRYWLRHSLKPGITGLAQVRGFRGATDKQADLEQRLAADLEYIEKWSIARELIILFSTLFVIRHKNAF